jgi:hypothetical protein
MAATRFARLAAALAIALDSMAATRFARLAAALAIALDSMAATRAGAKVSARRRRSGD